MGFVGDIQRAIARRRPWYLQNPNIARFLEAIDVNYDASIGDLAEGMRLSQPLRCDSSALPVLSRDRGIRLYPTEPEASKRRRLAMWLQLHRQRGTHQGEERHVAPYFLPDVPMMRVVHQDGNGDRATWHTLDSDGAYSVHKAEPSNWDYDGQVSQWSRYWFILYAPAALLSMSYYDDGGLYDDGEAYDGILDSQVALDLVAMARDWKAAHSVLWAYIVATDPTSFDPTATAVTDPTGWTSLPTGNWGAPIDGSGVRTRPPSAHWIYSLGAG